MKFTKGIITIVTPETPGNMDPLPDIGQAYYAYEDGKIRRSREYKVVIQGYKRMWRMPKTFRKAWKKHVSEYYWVYAKKTDYIIKAWVLEGHKNCFCYFVRTPGGHWYSMQYECDYFIGNLALDITGENHNWLDKIEEEERKCHVDG